MKEFTAEEVQKAVKVKGITKIDEHDCYVCGYMTGYIIFGKQVSFDHGCFCIKGPFRSSPKSFQDIADWINMQNYEENKVRIAKKCGFGFDQEGILVP